VELGQKLTQSPDLSIAISNIANFDEISTQFRRRCCWMLEKKNGFEPLQSEWLLASGGEL
jgi:hypothetical protein